VRRATVWRRKPNRTNSASPLITSILLGLLLSAVTASSPAEDPATLRLYYWQAPTVVNPHLSQGTKDLSASRIVYEPLASFDGSGELIPFLAASIPSLENGGIAADGRSVTWTLKRDVKWADGTPFTTADVVFTYEYINDPAVNATSAASYDRVSRVEALDEHTVRVHFRDVNPAWAQPFVGVKGMILPRHRFADHMGGGAAEVPANRIAIGTGPYRVQAFIEEDILIIGEDLVSTVRIEYVRNPHFREPGKPHFDRVVLNGGGGDAEIAARAVADGLTDFAWNLQVNDARIDEIESGGKGHVVELLGAWVERIMLNFTDPDRETVSGERASVGHPHPILSDLRVRKAIAQGIDRTEVLALYGRGGRATDTLLVSPTRYRTPNAAIEYDPEAARALLETAGWSDSDGDAIRDKDGRRLRLLFQTSINPIRQQTQELVRRDLAALGIEVELKSIDSSVFFGPASESTNTRRHFYASLEEFAYSNKGPDPGPYMAAWTCGEVATLANNWSTANWARYCNNAFDALHARSAIAMDSERRQRLFIEMSDLLIQDAAVIPLVHLVDFSGISASLDGFAPTPWDVEVWNINDWQRK